MPTLTNSWYDRRVCNFRFNASKTQENSFRRRKKKNEFVDLQSRVRCRSSVIDCSLICCCGLSSSLRKEIVSLLSPPMELFGIEGNSITPFVNIC